MNAANLGLRFLLELAALGGFGVWAWMSVSGWWRYAAAALTVVAVAALWGIFAVPDDPSRSGNAPVPVPGALRLILELLILLGGSYGWYASGFPLIGGACAALVIAHYALSMDRISWLLQQ